MSRKSGHRFSEQDMLHPRIDPSRGTASRISRDPRRLYAGRTSRLQGSPPVAKKSNKSNVVADTPKKAGKAAPAEGGVPRQDEARVMALDLPPGTLSPAMQAYFEKCQEKLGFVPNVLLAYAFDNAKLEAFAAFYNDLMLAPSGLSKLEREMIAVAVSSQNRCYYCLTAHGAAVRQYSGQPILGEHMVMNYRAARLDKRQRAMLDFAVKLTAEPWAV